MEDVLVMGRYWLSFLGMFPVLKPTYNLQVGLEIQLWVLRKQRSSEWVCIPKFYKEITTGSR
jgi:hypothetical protein